MIQPKPLLLSHAELQWVIAILSRMDVVDSDYRESIVTKFQQARGIAVDTSRTEMHGKSWRAAKLEVED